jgi:hypothetical protein
MLRVGFILPVGFHVMSYSAGRRQLLRRGDRNGALWTSQRADRAARLDLEKAKTLSAQYGVRASIDVELYENVLDMRLHGLRSDAEFACDFLV